MKTRKLTLTLGTNDDDGELYWFHRKSLIICHDGLSYVFPECLRVCTGAQIELTISRIPLTMQDKIIFVNPKTTEYWDYGQGYTDRMTPYVNSFIKKNFPPNKHTGICISIRFL